MVGVRAAKAPKWPAVVGGVPGFVVAANGPLGCAKDPEAFHRQGLRQEQAEVLCEGCRVVVECRSFALADPRLIGVWGGTTAEERQRLRRAAGASV